MRPRRSGLSRDITIQSRLKPLLRATLLAAASPGGLVFRL